MVREKNPMEFSDYLAILKRRKVQLFVPFVLVMLATFTLAFALPPTYQSTATILIEQQEVPSDLVETTVTGYVRERLEAITKQIMTSDKLWQIAQNSNLYPEERRLEPREEIVKRVYENISVEMIDVDATNPGTARHNSLTVAFTVSFQANDPEVAQQVANKLATLYQEEYRRTRLEQSTEVTNFFKQEADELSDQIKKLQAQLAEFKQENRGTLPEFLDVNLKLLEQTNTKLEQTQEQIRLLEQQRGTLQAQLGVTDPNILSYGNNEDSLLMPNQRLNMLHTEYLSKSSTYSYNHPDMVKMRREINLLEKQLGRKSGTGEMLDKLEILRSELAEASRKYSQEHPDVKKLNRSIAALEKEIHNASGAVSNQSTAPDNPQYVSLQSQLNGVVASLEAEKEKRNQLEKKIEEYEARLLQTPAVERDYVMLNREYEQAVEEYNKIKEKLRGAELAEQLEKEGKGGRFTLVGSATLPTEPIKPNRLGIALLGFTLAFGSGLGSAAISEHLDRSVRGFRGVAAILKEPPLAGIPYIKNSTDMIRRRSRNQVTVLLISSAIVLLIVVLHFYWKPMDQWWSEAKQQNTNNSEALQTTAE